jgi:serine/threonine protein kinase
MRCWGRSARAGWARCIALGTPGLGRDVAIKVLPESLAKDGDRLRRFEQEARAVAALNHPNILAIHDIGEQGGFPYLVSELLEGSSLRWQLEGGARTGNGPCWFWAMIRRGECNWCLSGPERRNR